MLFQDKECQRQVAVEVRLARSYLGLRLVIIVNLQRTQLLVPIHGRLSSRWLRSG